MSYNELVDQINDLILVEFPRSSPNDIQAKCVESANKYDAVIDKISFDKYYQLKLHKRLTLTGGKCLEYEKQMIKEIRNFNDNFISDFEELLLCIEDSKKISTAFCQQREPSPSFNPIIIPQYTSPLPMSTELPCSPFRDLCNQFETFYTDQKKKTPFVNNYLSFCNLKLTFPGNNKEYTVRSNFFYSTVLLSLSEKELHFSEIVDLLMCDRIYTSKIIVKLYKMKLIKRTGASEKLNDDDIISLNTKFSSPNKFISIPPHLPSDQERYPLIAEMEKKEAIKLAIIRILKQSTNLKKSILEEKVKKILEHKFNVSTEMMDKEIASIEGYYSRKTIVNGEEILTYIG